MRILAIDTSSFPASVSVLENGIVLGEHIIRNKKKHSQMIMVMTENMLKELGLDIADIDLFAVSKGPGSFTGLRIGISTVRAFAQALKKPAIEISSLEAIAYNFSGREGVIVPMTDALRDEVYTAAYTFTDGELCEIMAPCVMTAPECAALFEGALFVGDGAIKHSECIENNGGVVAPGYLSEVRASSVAAAAEQRAAAGDTGVYSDIKPLYLRKSQAERELEKKRSAEQS